MEETYQALLDLQALDDRMNEAREKVRRFEPEFEAIQAPVEEAEREIESVRQRLTEMQAELRRLERAAEDKTAQLRKYEARLERVRTVREESAARAEIDLIQGAIEADETDALGLMDQVKRTELKLDELEGKLRKLQEDARPRLEELEKGRIEAQEQLQILEDQRQNKAIRLKGDAARLYERVRSGKTRVTLAAITPDGACGHCFSVVPIQERNQIGRREGLHRCEACGVILYTES